MQNKIPENIIDLTRDNAFKVYFKGQGGESPPVLTSLLQHFLPLTEGSVVESVEILDGEANTPNEKNSILDIKANIRRWENGKLLPAETVNVEMQSSGQRYFTNRLLHYASRLYNAQIKRGQEYNKLYPVYSLAFSKDNLPEFTPITDEHYHVCRIRREDSERSRQALFSNGLQFVVVELNKFTVPVEKIVDIRDAWCYLLKQCTHMSEQEFGNISAKGEEMKEAVERLWVLSEDECIQEQLEAEEKQRRDQWAREEYAKEEGIEEGIEKGRKEGMEKSRQEIALQMLQKGMDIPTICECTSLTEEEIQALQEKV